MYIFSCILDYFFLWNNVVAIGVWTHSRRMGTLNSQSTASQCNFFWKLDNYKAFYLTQLFIGSPVITVQNDFFEKVSSILQSETFSDNNSVTSQEYWSDEEQQYPPQLSLSPPPREPTFHRATKTNQEKKKCGEIGRQSLTKLAIDNDIEVRINLTIPDTNSELTRERLISDLSVSC